MENPKIHFRKNYLGRGNCYGMTHGRKKLNGFDVVIRHKGKTWVPAKIRKTRPGMWQVFVPDAGVVFEGAMNEAKNFVKDKVDLRAGVEKALHQKQTNL